MSKEGQVIAVVGGQWGDEGKGKIIDALAEKADLVARGQGGDNAGHTVVVGNERYATHLLTSGLFIGKPCYIGGGVAFNPDSFIQERNTFAARGITVDEERVKVSPLATVVLGVHQAIDFAQEHKRGDAMIGTTGKGIGPAYTDDIARFGLRVGGFRSREYSLGKIVNIISSHENIKQYIAVIETTEDENELKKNPRLLHPDRKKYFLEQFDPEYYENKVDEWYREINPHMADVEHLIQQAYRNGLIILLEGAHGGLLDTRSGTYPCVTSSNPNINGVADGVGLPGALVDRRIGIFKAYSTRVGSGGFPTELFDETAEFIREKGQEYGTTTGRARRVGWFDGLAAEYTDARNNFTEIAITRGDILDELPEIYICNRYLVSDQVRELLGLGSNNYDRFIPEDYLLRGVVGDYSEGIRMKGWSTNITGVVDMKDLPPRARDYFNRLRGFFNPEAKLSFIGTGPERTQLIRI